MTLRDCIAICAFLFVSGCAAKDAERALLAREGLIGMTQHDIRMCAGLPSGKDGDIWMYEHGAVTPAGIAPVVPAPWGAVQINTGGGYCRVQLRFVKGRVAEVTYAGATDIFGARDAVCGPIVRTCLTYQGTARPN